jgi:hypothetical protein
MRGRRVEPPAEAVAEEDDVLIMSLHLKSGRFESRIEIPLISSDEAKQGFIESWLSLMAAGLKCSSKPDPQP